MRQVKLGLRANAAQFSLLVGLNALVGAMVGLERSVLPLVGEHEFDADLLLAPHRLYLEEVRVLRARADVKALAHVTGGGILGNLTRVLPEGVGVEIDWGSWSRPAVFDWLTEHGVEEEEQRRVFNLGIGMCAVVPAGDAGSGTVIGRLT